MRIVDLVIKRIESSRKVGKALVSGQDVINFLHTIDSINNLQWETKWLGDYRLEEYYVAEKFGFFFKPSRVSLGAPRKYRDMLIRNGELDYTEGGEILSPGEFWMVNQKLCNQGRWECKLTPILDFRREVLLSAVEDMICVNGYLPFTDKIGFMPIEVDVLPCTDDEYSKKISAYYNSFFSNVFN